MFHDGRDRASAPRGNALERGDALGAKSLAVARSYVLNRTKTAVFSTWNMTLGKVASGAACHGVCAGVDSTNRLLGWWALPGV
jgi:hypothetical protein